MEENMEDQMAMDKYLTATAIIDSDHPSIRRFAEETAGGAADPIDCVKKLFLAVREAVRYDPYTPFYFPEHYQASRVLERGRGFCVPKASLLCAAGRASGIPTRLGFAIVRNHLATKQLLDFMGSDLFVYHGYVEFYLEERWVKATPAFNSALCLRHGVPPLEFNGRDDSLFQAYNLENKRFMEYVEDLGTYDDIPVALIVSGWERVYGKERVAGWIRMFEEGGEKSVRDFAREEVVTP
jgi:transglutaminase-like putative cysteine protease